MILHTDKLRPAVLFLEFQCLSKLRVNLTLTRRLWMGFALMALLTLTSTLVGWYNLRFIINARLGQKKAAVRRYRCWNVAPHRIS